MSRKKFRARIALGAAAHPALIWAFGTLAFLAAPSRAFAADDLLHALKPVTDATLAEPAADD